MQNKEYTPILEAAPPSLDSQGLEDRTIDLDPNAYDQTTDLKDLELQAVKSAENILATIQDDTDNSVRPITVSQVHVIGERGVFVGPHPDAAKAEALNAIAAEEQQRTEKLAKFLHDTPNLNDRYQDTINLVESLLKKDGLSAPSPIFLDVNTYNETLQGAGHSERIDVEGREQGRLLYGQPLVRVDPEQDQLFGPGNALGIALHEAAHATAEHQASILATETDEAQAIGREPLTYGNLYRGEIGFVKPRLLARDKEQKMTYGQYGHVFEEGFADLYRVKGLKELGMEVRGKELTDYKLADNIVVTFVGQGEERPLIDNETGRIAMPVKYAAGWREIGPNQCTVNAGPPGVAAFGVDLLDQHLPGLWEDMLATRKGDVQAETRFIQKVNSVRPDLYRTLQKFQYTAQGFYDAHKVIVNALGISNEVVKG